MGWQTRLKANWQKRGVGAVLLLPIAMVFALLVYLRHLAYRLGWRRVVRLPVPVVVIGNVTAGGSGKTPLTLYLAQELARRGWRPGIVSRGYGGRAKDVEAVTADSDAALVGDEPLLLARLAGCPVFVGHDRVAAARRLLSSHTDCNVLIADDGLQHLRLARDVEVVVIDDRGLGNGWPLPAGPLRECPSRIAEADALVLNGDASVPPRTRAKRVFCMRLVCERFRNLRDPSRRCDARDLLGRRLRALAGIGHPARFFREIEKMGLQAQTQVFPDHHGYKPADLAMTDVDALLMTEKDAVKCEAFAPAETWVLPVKAHVDPDLVQWVEEELNGRPPA